MATEVTFSLLSSSPSIVINGPSFVAQPVERVPRFVSGRSAAGTPYVYELPVTPLWEWEITFQDIALADKRALEEFFYIDARGRSNQFSYTHTNGNVYTARFAMDRLQWSRQGSALWACTIVLETTDEPT